MAWTTPATASAGSTALTAAFWNEQVRDNTNYLYNAPSVRCTKNATQAVNATTITAITWPGADSYDTDSMHDPASNNTRITINTAGVYIISAGIGTTASFGGYCELFVYVDGNTSTTNRIVYTGLDSSGLNAITTAAMYKFNAGQYIEAAIYLQNAKTVQTTTNQGHVHFAAHWIGSGA